MHPGSWGRYCSLTQPPGAYLELNSIALDHPRSLHAELIEVTSQAGEVHASIHLPAPSIYSNTLSFTDGHDPSAPNRLEERTCSNTAILLRSLQLHIDNCLRYQDGHDIEGTR
jgi:hypothetical protein